MTAPGWNDPVDEDRNPHRTEERRHVRDEMEARLRDRDVWLTGDEADDEVLAMVNAMEDFEARRASLGGDSFTNTPGSSEPDAERFVLPMRRDDEAVEAYVRRVRDAISTMGDGD